MVITLQPSSGLILDHGPNQVNDQGDLSPSWMLSIKSFLAT